MINFLENGETMSMTNKLLLWNEDDTEAMREEKIRLYKLDPDSYEDIFKASLQQCHNCQGFLTFEELELYELHCENCVMEKD